MIVSHEHRFIFLRVPKTASTSVEVVLSSIAGPDAIVTPNFPPVPGHEPRNFRRFFNPVPETLRLLTRPSERGQSTLFALRGTARDLKRRRAFYEHMTAELVRDRLGRKAWDRYFTFCFVRNPWDRVASAYYYGTHRANPRPTLEEWVRRRGMPRSTWPIYTISGKVAVDFVGRYEQLEDDLRSVLHHLRVDVGSVLPRTNSEQRPPGSGGRPRFTPALAAEIGVAFRNEIECFGYTAPAWATVR